MCFATENKNDLSLINSHVRIVSDLEMQTGIALQDVLVLEREILFPSSLDVLDNQVLASLFQLLELLSEISGSIFVDSLCIGVRQNDGREIRDVIAQRFPRNVGIDGDPEK